MPIAIRATVRRTLQEAYVRIRRGQLYRRAIRAPAALVILRYHSVGERDKVSRYLNPDLAISPTRFREHVRILARTFRVVVPDEIPDLLRERRSGICPAVLITFDDGYRDNYTAAAPILVEEGVRAAFYIATDPLCRGTWLWPSEIWRILPRLPEGALTLPSDGQWVVPKETERRKQFGRRLTRWLSALSAEMREEAVTALCTRAGLPRGNGLEEMFVTPDQLKAMDSAGMIVGAHTRSHPQLDLLQPDRRLPELEGARRDLEAILGKPIRHLAYPNPGGRGTIQSAVRAAAAEAGYRTAVTSVTGRVVPGVDLLRLPRIGVYAGSQEAQLFSLLANLPRQSKLSGHASSVAAR
jgi:peptidoglycan/xylan/chitin deacetylase (PgdA/CDA1 family)